MKVFLGWSGDRSKQLAIALRDWLPLVLHYVEPWMSESDIAAGERWSQELAAQLETSNFGIVSVTADNLNEPWIFYEAGSLAKSMEDGRVVPFLLDLDISDVSGPLAQFQTKKVSKEGTWDVICAIRKCGEESIDENRVRTLFDSLWSNFHDKVSSIPDKRSEKPRRNQHEVLEELVTSVRTFDSRLNGLEEFIGKRLTPASRRSRRRRIKAPVLELQEFVGRGPGDPIGLLFLGSYLREDFPPFTELCNEVYRDVSSGDLKSASSRMRQLQRLAEFLSYSGFAEDFIDSKEEEIFFRELPLLVEAIIGNLLLVTEKLADGKA